MTGSSVTSVSVDTSRRDQSAPQCAAYKWCELDHRDRDIDAGLHEMHVAIACGDCQEEFLLEVTPNGDPRISSAGLDGREIWIEPREQTNTFKNISAVLAAASNLYDEFVGGLHAEPCEPR